MFDEYIRGRILSLGVSVGRNTQDGELLLKRMCKPKQETLISDTLNTLARSALNKIDVPNGTMDPSSTKLSDQMPIEINKTHQETNISNSNLFEYLENAKRQDSETSKDVFQQTSNSHLPTSYAKNFFPQDDRPDNTSSSLTTEKNNVLEGKRERKEACQIQKTHHHHLSDIQKLTKCRTRKITM